MNLNLYISKPISPAFLDDMQFSDEQAEKVLFNRLAFIDNTERLSYAEKGFIAKFVQIHLLHHYRTDPKTNEPFSFTAWLRAAAPFGYSTAFAAMRDVDELSDVPRDELAQIPEANFPVMKQLSTAVRNDPKVLHVAKTGRSEDLVEHVRANHSDQHLEHRKHIKFTLDESAVEPIERALALAEEKGARNRGEALEMLAAMAMETWQLEEEVEAAHEQATEKT